MTRRSAWRLSKPSGARADAPGIYVPTVELDGAAIGDEVVVQSEDGSGEDRRAVIAEMSERDGTAYFRLDFDSPR